MIKNPIENENEETSNNEGDGSIYHYEHLLGQPQSCVMYRNVGVNGEVSYSNEKLSGSLGWTSEKTVEWLLPVLCRGIHSRPSVFSDLADY